MLYNRSTVDVSPHKRGRFPYYPYISNGSTVQVGSKGLSASSSSVSNKRVWGTHKPILPCLFCPVHLFLYTQYWEGEPYSNTLLSVSKHTWNVGSDWSIDGVIQLWRAPSPAIFPSHFPADRLLILAFPVYISLHPGYLALYGLQISQHSHRMQTTCLAGKLRGGQNFTDIQRDADI